MFKFRGKVVSKKTISGHSEKTGKDWSNTEFVIEVHDNENKDLVVMKAFGQTQDQAKEGDYVEGGFSLKSNEWKDKRYNEITVQFLNPVTTSDSMRAPQPPLDNRPEPRYQGSNTDNPFLGCDDKDDLPF